METFTIKRHDRHPVYEYELAGSSESLAGATVLLLIRPLGASTPVTSYTMEITSEAGRLVRYAWEDGDTDTAGEYDTEIEVTYADGRKETWPMDGYDRLRIVADLVP